MSTENLDEKTPVLPYPVVNATTEAHIVGPARPTAPAHIITDDQEAIEVGRALCSRGVRP